MRVYKCEGCGFTSFVFSDFEKSVASAKTVASCCRVRGVAETQYLCSKCGGKVVQESRMWTCCICDKEDLTSEQVLIELKIINGWGGGGELVATCYACDGREETDNVII